MKSIFGYISLISASLSLKFWNRLWYLLPLSFFSSKKPLMSCRYRPKTHVNGVVIFVDLPGKLGIKWNNQEKVWSNLVFSVVANRDKQKDKDVCKEGLPQVTFWVIWPIPRATFSSPFYHLSATYATAPIATLTPNILICNGPFEPHPSNFVSLKDSSSWIGQEIWFKLVTLQSPTSYLSPCHKSGTKGQKIFNRLPPLNVRVTFYCPPLQNEYQNGKRSFTAVFRWWETLFVKFLV